MEEPFRLPPPEQSPRASLANPESQRALLDDSPVPKQRFDDVLKQTGRSLLAVEPEILQINIGRLCNMSCRHCHVDAGPHRVSENMSDATLEACIEALVHLPTVHTVDITGGAPELHPRFRDLVRAAASSGRHVIDRCNLTVLLLPRMTDLPLFLADHGVEVVCSLPHYRSNNTDSQRGEGTFQQSIEALRRLNDAGYGKGDPSRILTLISNPTGAYLPAQQPTIQTHWKTVLGREQSVVFDRLISLNNMPVSRLLEWLMESGNVEGYMQRLESAFNPDSLDGLMCRNTLSVSYDGRLFDCDFNQMLELDLDTTTHPRPSIHNLRSEQVVGRAIRTGQHCFGCTAGSGSSCGGRTA